MNKTISNFLIGFLAGAAAGAIAGILFAPDKGSKTRQNLRKKVRDLSDEYGLGIEDLIDEIGLETEPVPQPHRRKSERKSSDQPAGNKRQYTRKTRNPKPDSK